MKTNKTPKSMPRSTGPRHPLVHPPPFRRCHRRTDFRSEDGDRKPRMTRIKRKFSTEHRKTRKRDFEQDKATERTEIGRTKSSCPASMEIRRPFIRAMSSSHESALCSLCGLLLKPI